MKFKTWLENEEVDNLFQNIKPSSEYPNALQNATTYFEKFKLLFDEASKADYITKDQYKKLKETFEGSLKNKYMDIFHKFAKQYLDEQIKKNQEKMKEMESQGISYDVNDFIYIKDPLYMFVNELFWSNLGQFYKILNKKSNEKFFNTFPEEIKQACMEIKKYAEYYSEAKKKVEDLKSKVKAPSELRAMKKAEEEEKKQKEIFSRPIASRMALEKLERIISNLLPSMKQKFVDSEKENMLRSIEHYKNIPDYKKAVEAISKYGFAKFFKIDSTNKKIEEADDIEQKINSALETKWLNVSEFFKVRMNQKITPIVAKKTEKNDNFEMKVIQLYTSGGVIEGRFSFKFADNSSFEVKHQAVSVTRWNRDGGGFTFYRFPTHFNNIVTADGTKYNFLPEREMYPKFANIKPPEDAIEKDEPN